MNISEAQGRAIGLATAAYHQATAGTTELGADFNANIAALVTELGKHEAEIPAEFSGRDDVVAAIKSTAKSTADQVGAELLQIIAALASLFGSFAVLAESSPGQINVPAYLQVAGIKNIASPDDEV